MTARYTTPISDETGTYTTSGGVCQDGTVNMVLQKNDLTAFQFSRMHRDSARTLGQWLVDRADEAEEHVSWQKRNKKLVAGTRVEFLFKGHDGKAYWEDPPLLGGVEFTVAELEMLDGAPGVIISVEVVHPDGVPVYVTVELFPQGDRARHALSQSVVLHAVTCDAFGLR